MITELEQAGYLETAKAIRTALESVLGYALTKPTGHPGMVTTSDTSDPLAHRSPAGMTQSGLPGRESSSSASEGGAANGGRRCAWSPCMPKNRAKRPSRTSTGLRGPISRQWNWPGRRVDGAGCGTGRRICHVGRKFASGKPLTWPTDTPGSPATNCAVWPTDSTTDRLHARPTCSMSAFVSSRARF